MDHSEEGNRGWVGHRGRRALYWRMQGRQDSAGFQKGNNDEVSRKVLKSHVSKKHRGVTHDKESRKK